MGSYLFEMFGISLLLTLAIELPISFLLGIRQHNLLLILLVNILTNPAAVLLHWLGFPQIPIEIGVAAMEASIYFWFSKDKNWHIPHPLGLALTANGASWVFGILIQWIGGFL